ncbi:MAG: hypothetical protein WC966_12585 [Bradymonadales bacterium]
MRLQRPLLECVPIHGTQLCEPPTAFRFDIRVETKVIPRYPPDFGKEIRLMQKLKNLDLSFGKF